MAVVGDQRHQHDQRAGKFNGIGAAALGDGDQVGDDGREIGEEPCRDRAQLGHAHVPEEDAEDADAEHGVGQLRPHDDDLGRARRLAVAGQGGDDHGDDDAQAARRA